MRLQGKISVDKVWCYPQLQAWKECLAFSSMVTGVGAALPYRWYPFKQQANLEETAAKRNLCSESPTYF